MGSTEAMGDGGGDGWRAEAMEAEDVSDRVLDAASVEYEWARLVAMVDEVSDRELNEANEAYETAAEAAQADRARARWEAGVRMRRATAMLHAPRFARPNDYATLRGHPRLGNPEPVQDPMAGYRPLAKWSPCRTPDFAQQARCHRCPSLLTLAIAGLVKHMAQVDSLGAWLPESLKHRISAALCERHKMDARVAALFFCDAPSVIRIPNCTLITHSDFLRILHRFSPWEQLQELHLGFCGRPFTDECVNEFFKTKVFYNLKAITLHAAYSLSNKGIKILLNATPHLAYLNLSQCSNITNVGFHTYATLQSLIVDDCGGLNAHEFVPNLLSMRNLRVLSLAKIKGVNDELVEHFTLGLGSQLQDLSLAECSNLTDISMSKIAMWCPLLKKLNLKNLIKLTDFGLGFITTNSKMMLEVLDVTKCKFSDEAIVAFISALGGSLENLSINHVDKVADHTLMALSKNSHASLQRLDASWCRRISDDCLGFLVSVCPHLRELRLIGCTQVTNKFLEGHNNPTLKLVL